jgi:hypothetical protein
MDEMRATQPNSRCLQLPPKLPLIVFTVRTANLQSYSMFPSTFTPVEHSLDWMILEEYSFLAEQINLGIPKRCPPASSG